MRHNRRARSNPWEEIEPGIMFDPDARNSELVPEYGMYRNPAQDLSSLSDAELQRKIRETQQYISDVERMGSYWAASIAEEELRHMMDEVYRRKGKKNGRRNPFLVTPGGQAIGAMNYSRYDKKLADSMGLPVRSREFDPAFHRQAASGAVLVEGEGLRLVIKKVGNTYHIFDNEGNDTGKYAHTLDKAQDIMEKMLAKQA